MCIYILQSIEIDYACERILYIANKQMLFKCHFFKKKSLNSYQNFKILDYKNNERDVHKYKGEKELGDTKKGTTLCVYLYIYIYIANMILTHDFDLFSTK